MWMRVAIGIHGSNLVKVQETYDLMSQKYFTHATLLFSMQELHDLNLVLIPNCYGR